MGSTQPVATLEGPPCDLCFLREISQEKKLESQIYTAQKMEAVGTLASGIAHDFNNLLVGVQGYVCLLLFDANGSPVQTGRWRLSRTR